MGREWRFIDALHATAVPVPPPVVYCDDRSVVGAPFYVMGFVDGMLLETPQAARAIPAENRHRLGRALVSTLAALHAVEPAAVGLDDIAHADG